MAHQIVQLTSGPSGTGKSYVRVSRFILDSWIPDNSGTVFTNVNIGRVPNDHPFPPKPWQDDLGRTRTKETFIRRMCNASAKKYGGKPIDYAKRIRRIPPAVNKSWRDNLSGPWEYFDKIDISGAHIQIDEIHVFCPIGANWQRPIKWQSWLGELRHRGATCEFMTQNIKKLHKKLIGEAALRRTLTDFSMLREPFFNIPIGDWLELLAAFTRKYKRVTRVTEKILEDEHFVVNHKESFQFNKEYFAYYNSHEKPQAGGKGGREESHQFERRSIPGVIWWFIRKYAGQLGSRGALFAVFIWVCFLGGGGMFITYGMGYFTSVFAPAAETADVIPVSAEASQVDVADALGQDLALLQGGTDASAGYVYEPLDAASTHQQILEERSTGATLTPRTPADIAAIKAQQEMLAEIEELKNKNLQIAADMAEVVEKRKRGFAVVMITPGEVTFRDGYTYQVGEEVDYGIYTGSTVTSIDYKKRAVILDDTIILRMGRDDGFVDGAGVPDDGEPDDTAELQ